MSNTDEVVQEIDAVVDPEALELEDEEFDLAEDELDEDLGAVEDEGEDREALEARMGEAADTGASTGDPVRQYLHEIGRVKLLTLEEEISLAATRKAEKLKRGWSRRVTRFPSAPGAASCASSRMANSPKAS